MTVWNVRSMFVTMKKLDIPSSDDGRRAWVLYRLRLAGHTLGTLARELGVHRSCPGRAFWAPYPKMEKALADKLGVHPAQIWPERYDRDGKPNRPMGRPRERRPRSSRHDEKLNTQDGGSRNVQTHEAA